MTQQRNDAVTTNSDIIGRIVVIVPCFTQWTGTRAMHEGDYTIGTGGQLPPKEVTKSLGLKAIIDTQELRVFDRIKHKAEVLLEGCGVKYLSGWAIPEDKADEVFKSLDALVEQYSKEKADFLSRYDVLVKDWADKNPSFSKEIMEGKLDVNAVSERINAGYETFRLQPVSAEKALALAKSIGGLASELIASVTRSARIFFKESFLGKTRASRKTVNAVLKIRQKLQGLAFLSSSILPVIAFIDKVLCEMPSEGYFSGEPFWKLAALVKTLGDATLLEEVMADPAYAAAAFPMQETESSSAQEALDLDVPQEDANSHLPIKDSSESLDSTQQESPSESLDLQGFAKGDENQKDLFKELEEFFDTPVGQGKLSSENPTTTEEKGALVSNNDEKSSISQVAVSPECSEPIVPVTVPAVDVGEGLYF